MLLKDEFNLKYKTLKKDGHYYLVSVQHRQGYKNKGDNYYKIEVEGKENVFTYIKNNKLVKIEEEENES